jgi:PST family polysaccharide transporter
MGLDSTATATPPRESATEESAAEAASGEASSPATASGEAGAHSTAQQTGEASIGSQSTGPVAGEQAAGGPGDPADERSVAELTEATVGGLRWISMSRIGTECLLVLSMVALARLVTPAAFGAFAVALIVVELAISVPTEGIGSALVNRRELTREHLQVGTALALIVAVAMGAVTWLLAGILIAPLCGTEAASLVRLASPLFLLAAIGTVPMALLRRRLDFRMIAIMEIASSAVRALGAVALAGLAGLGGSALVFGSLAGTVVATAIAFAAAPAPLPRLRLRPAREVGDYGGPASLAAVAWAAFSNGDYMVIAARLGTAAAGQYWRAYTLAVGYQSKISIVMYTIAFPVLSRSANDDDLFALRSRMVRLLTVVLFPLLTGLAITAPLVIPWLFGVNWEPAVLPTQLLCAGGASTLVIDAVGTALMATGRPRALLGYGVSHFVIYVGSVVFVAPLGIAAVALDAAVVHGLFLIVAYALLLRGKETNPLRSLWGDIAPATVACLAMAAVAVPVDLLAGSLALARPLHLLAVGLSGGAAYLLALRTGFAQPWSDLVALTRRMLPLERLRRRIHPPDLAGAESA